MILLIDNYDSFTYNLVHLVGGLDREIVVRRNDALSTAEALAMGPEAIILSPGPCSPSEAGICVETVTAAAERGVPLMGVCLGHQSIGQAFGATISRAGRMMHGKTSTISHNADPLFDGIPSPFTATRYHSLVIRPDTVPDTLEVLASADDDGEIMAVRVRNKPVYGVQFHPESIASEHGLALFRNFLALTGQKQAA
ncbi:anthranilate synthase component II [Aquisalinus flavus]|uniref:Aminodeoxychorismate/anthranilate synthase component II n=1 Tax=Aquisalinus flavus TaxID=1526572 RepID=A0A8J2V485_9PROT|nr:aminodeoxychorismate/anthranilate synthase component II [Aquisalinus flavus]MBD0427792.1 aminodeoxychorismate/anthranilate synthase component II [Aquisalinus flavus]UNE47565.1 aminodeoxychorismate/anthranilate synthase component II [Aquisalinus flavus]GGD03864.1 aminodeoxychorismate/anthranilate synthase component II [Aquisalinus flavus]